MKTRLPFWLLFFVVVSCEDDREIECGVTGAKAGYGIVTPLAYDYEYHYAHTGGRLTKVEQVDINSKERLSITEFEYDAEGRVSLEITKYSGGISYRYYHFEPRSLTTGTYTVIASDTSAVSEEQHFYVENPENKVYHHPENKSSFKFQNGNLIEYGAYEVSGTDTTDTFYERYTYDHHINHYNFAEYRLTIPSDFIWAKIVSKNNLVRAQYIDGGWDVFYLYTYDENDRLLQYIGKSGITVTFEYNCR